MKALDFIETEGRKEMITRVSRGFSNSQVELDLPSHSILASIYTII